MTRTRIIIATLIASLAGCATEADRACPAIRATGVAATPTNYVACRIRAGQPAPACPSGWDCWTGVAAHGLPEGMCSPRCSADRDCAGTAPAGRGAYCYRNHCIVGCRAHGECPSGTTCEGYSGVAEGSACAPVHCEP